jgi:fructokinase
VIVSRLGADEAGRELRDRLEGQGLDLEFVQADRELPTGWVDVDTTDPNAPRYTIHQPVAWDAVELRADLVDLAARADAICYGTLFQRDSRSRTSLHGFLDAAGDAFRLYDVNLRQDYYDRAWIEPSLRAANAVKLNEGEVEEIARVLGLPSRESGDLAACLRERFHVGITCVTRGARGCVVYGDDEVVDVPGEAIDVADAVGAGDAFTAAFLSAHLSGMPLGVASRFANAAGGLVASRRGAMPLLRDTYRQLLARLSEKDGH